MDEEAAASLAEAGTEKGAQEAQAATASFRARADAKEGDEDHIKTCVAKVKKAGQECVLDPGTYEIADPIDIPSSFGGWKGGTIRSRDGPDSVTITGTQKINVAFKECKDKRCGPGVLEAKLDKKL